MTESLAAMLVARGVPDADVARAERDGTLEILAIEHLVLPEPVRYTVGELAERSNLPAAQVVQFWRALGFIDPSPAEKTFTDDDVAMLEVLGGLMSAGIVDPDLAVQMTRVIGSSIARIAIAQVEGFTAPDEDDEIRASAALGADPDKSSFLPDAAAVLEMMPRAMEYVWRRHMQAAARSMALRAGGDDPSDAIQAIGFADLVGFTALSQQVDSHELAEFVDRFESLAYDTVTQLGGRVVKMIGDEVMFTAPDAAVATEIALSLSEAYRDDDALSDVRVGVAVGPVLVREGDCYGPVVNLASRIVGIAFPGTVVVSDEIHDALADDPTLDWRSLHRRQLKDIGRVPLWMVHRVGDPFRPRSRRDEARAERAERVERAVRRRERGRRPNGDSDSVDDDGR